MQEVTRYEDTDIVSRVLMSLRQRLGSDRFDLWVDAGTVFKFSEGELNISSPTNFTVQRLRNQLRPQIEAAVTDVLGYLPTVKFSISARGTAATISTVSFPSSSNSDSAEPVPSNSGSSQASGATTQGIDTRPNSPRDRSQRTGQKRSSSQHKRRFANLADFEVGDGNKLAFSSAELVLSNLGEFSPFFLTGPCGVGKTHLLEGIWRTIRRRRLGRAVYLSAEQFTTQFLQALRGSGLPSFRRKYRDVDTLILDDVQFFAGKNATIVEFLHTLETLTRQRRQVILAADCSLADLAGLGNEIATRISAGLVCPVQKLDEGTRHGVLKRLVRSRNWDISESVLKVLAEKSIGDGRMLQGVVNQLWATSLATGKPICPRLANDVAEKFFPQNRQQIRLSDIERVVCDIFRIDAKQLQSNRRTRNVSHPRMLAMWLARKHTRAALTEISEYFGRRSHSTVVAAQHTVDEWIETGGKVYCANQSCDARELANKLEGILKTG